MTRTDHGHADAVPLRPSVPVVLYACVHNAGRSVAAPGCSPSTTRATVSRSAPRGPSQDRR